MAKTIMRSIFNCIDCKVSNIWNFDESEQKAGLEVYKNPKMAEYLQMVKDHYGHLTFSMQASLPADSPDSGMVKIIKEISKWVNKSGKQEGG